MKLLLGTSNPAKVARLRWMLDGLDVQPVTPAEVGSLPDLDEGNVSVRANAETRASTWARASGLPTLATDGGLDLPGLGPRWQPARTRRAAGLHATDVRRAQHVIGLGKELAGRGRRAVWIEAAALAAAGGGLLGSWETRSRVGELAAEFDPRGLPTGFWVPGVVLFGQQRRRYGDLSPAERRYADRHWLRLRRLVRPAVSALVGQSNA